MFVNFFSKKRARFGDAKSETFFANGLRTFQPTKDSEMKINKSKQYKETRISCGRWIMMVNFKLGNEMWKVNWWSWHEPFVNIAKRVLASKSTKSMTNGFIALPSICLVYLWKTWPLMKRQQTTLIWCSSLPIRKMFRTVVNPALCVSKSQITWQHSSLYTLHIKNQLYPHKGVRISINEKLHFTPTQITKDYRELIWL